MSETISRLRELKKQAGMTYWRNSKGEREPIPPMSEDRARFVFPLYRPPVKPSKAVLKMRAVADEMLSGKYKAKEW